jgi:hypothetical protein
MQGEREKARDQDEGSGQQQPVGEGRSQSGNIPPETSSEPPRSLGVKRGTEVGHSADRGTPGQQGQAGTGQADLGSQAGTTLAGHSEQEDLGELGGEIDQPGSYAGGMSGRQAGAEREGFIGSEDEGTDAYLRENGGGDFAEQGQGPLDDAGESGSSDVERESERNENRDSDIEGRQR